MAKIQDYNAGREDGLVLALKIVQSDGIDALREEIKYRGITGFHTTLAKKDLEKATDKIKAMTVDTVMILSVATLHDEFGFGKQRLHKFREEFQKSTNASLNLDWLGGHYTTLEDYAVYLNEKYDLGLDVARIAVCQESHDKGNAKYKMADISHVLAELKEHGFEEAAEFLERKM